jgi:hypothetical protein
MWRVIFWISFFHDQQSRRIAHSMTLGSWRSLRQRGAALVDVQRDALRPARGVRPRRRGR